MNYQYIEQLIERYFEAQTSQEEEQILQLFFSQRNVPQHLRQWQPYFQATKALQTKQVSSNFDQKLMARMAFTDVKIASTPSATSSWHRPYKIVAGIAAMFALVLVGASVNHLMTLHERSKTPVVLWDYNPDSYKDSYDNPEVAYDESMEALRLLSQQLNTIVHVDTTKATSMK